MSFHVIHLAVLSILTSLVFAEQLDTRPFMKALKFPSSQGTFTADVVQQKSLPALDEPVVTEGTIWISPQKAFRWEQGNPVISIAVYDGEKVYLIDAQTKKADCLSPKNRKIRPLMLLLGMGEDSTYERLMENFTPLSTLSEEGEYTIVLEPNSGSMKRFLTELTITLDEKTSFPKRVIRTQTDGAIITTIFNVRSYSEGYDKQTFVVVRDDYEW